MVILYSAFHPLLLENKAKQIRKDMDMDPKDNSVVHTVFDNPDRQYDSPSTSTLISLFSDIILL